MTDEHIPIRVQGWSLIQRVMFRFAAAYFFLYAAPFPVDRLLSLFTSVLSAVGIGTDWLGQAWRAIGSVEDGWQALTSWLSDDGWVAVEVIHQRTGSGDTAHDFVKLGAIAVIAAWLTLMWSLLDRRRIGYPRLGKWLHLGARWYLGFTMLSYGLIKLYSGQFMYPSLIKLLQPIGDLSPMGMVWTFMGSSKPYEVFAGLGETIGGLLLLWRRTSLLGCVVVIAVMTNVVALNWMFDVPVKLYSTNLLLIGIALLAPDCARLRCVFVTNRSTEPVDLTLPFWSPGMRRALIVSGWCWIGFHLFNQHGMQMRLLEQRAAERSELYGVWEVERMLRDGKQVSIYDRARWDVFAVDTRNQAWSRTYIGQRRRMRFEADVDAGVVAVSPIHAEEPEDREQWTLELGTKTVKRSHPAPRIPDDMRGPVDVERPSLVLKGPWEGRQLELHLVRKAFDLERGFHWVQELPYNR